jgi:hypothetical protein
VVCACFPTRRGATPDKSLTQRIPRSTAPHRRSATRPFSPPSPGAEAPGYHHGIATR